MKEPRQELIDLVEGHINPQGESLVAQSPNFDDIVVRILAGWTWINISDWLKVDKNEKIHWQDIKEYYYRFLYDDYREVRNKEQDFLIDELQDIQNIYEGVKLLNEKSMTICRNSEMLPPKELTASIKLQSDLAKDMAEIKKTIGINQKNEQVLQEGSNNTLSPDELVIVEKLDALYISKYIVPGRKRGLSV